MSMQVERSTADQVRKRLEEAKRRKKTGNAGRMFGSNEVDDTEDGDRGKHVPDGMSKQDLVGGSAKGYDDDDEEEDDDAIEDVGLGTIIVEEGEQENGDGDRGKKKNGDDADDELDPEFVAMMGFGGFGGSKKS